MVIYLLKVTLVWSLFLLLFELLYRHNRRFAANRIYLLLSIVMGLLLPLTPLPSNTPAVITATQQLYPAATFTGGPASGIGPTAPVTNSDHLFHWWTMLLLVYGIGVALLLLKSLIECGRIVYLILRKPYHVIQGYPIVVTGKVHAPYSFMGRIFITDPEAYTTQELVYILRHEAAHNERRHWLDLLFMQLVCIACWFQPLAWRYRYLLLLQHEYEADEMAAGGDAFTYGHFLIQQTLLGGVPSIAHSFHFSPIKHRIYMLTQQNKMNPNAWKYLFLLPALLCCTLLMAKNAGRGERIRQGQTTSYNGNTLTWRKTDTLFYNKAINRVQLIPEDDTAKKEIICKLNDEAVYQNEYLSTPASFGADQMSYSNYLKEQFVAQCKNIPDSLATVNVENMVIDKNGKVVYYELRYDNIRPNFKNIHHAFASLEPALNQIMDKIIAESPRWTPAKIESQPVNCTISFGTNISLKTVSFSVREITRKPGESIKGRIDDNTTNRK